MFPMDRSIKQIPILNMSEATRFLIDNKTPTMIGMILSATIVILLLFDFILISP
jgi:hypothetical protein